MKAWVWKWADDSQVLGVGKTKKLATDDLLLRLYGTYADAPTAEQREAAIKGMMEFGSVLVKVTITEGWE